MPSSHPASLRSNLPAAVRLTGGDIAHGLGWAILLLAVLAAVLPFVKLDLARPSQKLLLAAPLAVGAFLLVYLLTADLRHVSFGLPLAIAGYALEALGLLQDLRSRV